MRDQEIAISGNMWPYDDGSAFIKDGCGVQNREFSIKFKGFQHNLSILTGKRIHSPLPIVKEFDYSRHIFISRCHRSISGESRV